MLLIDVLLNYKFKIFGWVLISFSFAAFLLVLFYMADTGYFIDGNPEHTRLFTAYGFMELILLFYPYLSLSFPWY